jgi:hypothetical protein
MVVPNGLKAEPPGTCAAAVRAVNVMAFQTMVDLYKRAWISSVALPGHV